MLFLFCVCVFNFWQCIALGSNLVPLVKRVGFDVDVDRERLFIGCVEDRSSYRVLHGATVSHPIPVINTSSHHWHQCPNDPGSSPGGPAVLQRCFRGASAVLLASGWNKKAEEVFGCPCESALRTGQR